MCVRETPHEGRERAVPGITIEDAVMAFVLAGAFAAEDRVVYAARASSLL